MIHRLVAAYALLAILPGIPQAVDELRPADPWWVVAYTAGMVTGIVAIHLGAWRGRFIRAGAVLYALTSLAALLTLPAATVPAGSPYLSFLWGPIGTAVVCAGLGWSGRGAVVYAVLTALAYGRFAMTPVGGSHSARVAVSEAFFAIGAGLAVVVIALGMVSAAEAADRLAERVRRVEVKQAYDRAVAEERARLDQLIHDDVLTVLSAAAHAGDPETLSATARLATDTLRTVDRRPEPADPADGLPVEVFARTLVGAVDRVSSSVTVELDLDELAGSGTLRPDAAEPLLSGVREAVRNAVRHADADRVVVAVGVRRSGDGPTLLIQVTDDGRGFAVAEIPPARLGVRVSMTEALDALGAETSLTSRVGAGTRFELRMPLTPPTGPRGPATAVLAETPAGLPADFPVQRLAGVMWAVVAGSLLLGMANLDLIRPGPQTPMAMLLLYLVTYLVLRTGDELVMPLGTGLLAVALIGVIAALTASVLQPDRWPDLALWQAFPLQLIGVTLVLRRRSWLAALSTVLIVAGYAWWCLRSPVFGWRGLLAASFGTVAFFGVALVVRHALVAITRRQQALRAQELAGLEEIMRDQVARLQRRLWLSDLRDQARPTLLRIAQLDGTVPEDLKKEALVLEANLRDGLVARNLMNEQLSSLGDEARRRGVTLTYVDSRRSPLPTVVSRSVLAQMRAALDSPTLTRLVVRVAPDQAATAASVVAEDGAGMALVTIDGEGLAQSRSMPRG